MEEKDKQIVVEEKQPKKVKKEKPKTEKKGPSALSKVFKKEYSFEGFLLLLISLVAIVIGVLLLTPKGSPTLKISESVFLIGTYPSVFAGILIGLGAISLVIAIWPYYKPSISEIRRITWATKKDLLKDSAATFSFSLIMILFFFLVDLGIVALFSYIATIVR